MFKSLFALLRGWATTAKAAVGASMDRVELVFVAHADGVVRQYPVFRVPGLATALAGIGGACATPGIGLRWWGWLPLPSSVTMILVDENWDLWSQEERLIVLAHEAGHLYLGHLRSKPRSVGEFIERENEATYVGFALFGLPTSPNPVEQVKQFLRKWYPGLTDPARKETLRRFMQRQINHKQPPRVKGE